MSNPVRKLLDQCKTGFTVGQKLFVTGCALLYFLSPLDLIPDIPIIGWPDDLFALYLMVRVLLSPTLPKPGGPSPQPAGALTCRPRHDADIIDVEAAEVSL